MRPIVADRDRVRALDVCLNELEEANERDETVVTPRLASMVRRHVPAVMPGIPTVEAIQLVFRAQEMGLRRGLEAGPAAGLSPAEPPLAAPMAPDEARALTDQIRGSSQRVSLLLLEAHDRRAWSSLGYRSWERYVQRELGCSRSRSYELLAHGRFMRAVQEATGLSGIPDVSVYAACQLRPHLQAIVETVRDRVAGLPEDRALEVVNQAIREQRTRLVARTAMAFGPVDRRHLPHLFRAIDRLASMPPAAHLAAQVLPDELHRLANLSRAARWIGEFSRELTRR